MPCRTLSGGDAIAREGTSPLLAALPHSCPHSHCQSGPDQNHIHKQTPLFPPAPASCSPHQWGLSAWGDLHGEICIGHCSWLKLPCTEVPCSTPDHFRLVPTMAMCSLVLQEDVSRRGIHQCICHGRWSCHTPGLSQASFFRTSRQNLGSWPRTWILPAIDRVALPCLPRHSHHLCAQASIPTWSCHPAAQEALKQSSASRPCEGNGQEDECCSE